MPTADNNWAYFDYAATTPIDADVLDAFIFSLRHELGNPSGEHQLALVAKRHLEDAREQFAAVIAARAEEIVFTSGATEANNLALKGVLLHHDVGNARLVTLQSEHKSVLAVGGWLAQRGVDVEFLPVNTDGKVDLQLLEKALQTPTTLLSVMAVNNESGCVQDLHAIAALAQKYRAKLHVDASQALCKIALDVKDYQVDLLSFSAHKIHAPLGAGALYVRQFPKVRLQAQQHGGGQERNMRSGTVAVALNCAFANAAMIGTQNLSARNKYVAALRAQIVSSLPSTMQINVADAIAHIININTNLPAQQVLQRANAAKIALSIGSACEASAQAGSHVLHAMGLHAAALNSVRVSLSHLTTADEIDKLLEFLKQIAVEEI